MNHLNCPMLLAIFSDCGRACVVNSKRRNAMLAFLASFHAARTSFRAESAIMKVVYTVIRTESALLALQQVMTLAIERRLDCASVLQEIFNNLRILFLELTGKRETQRGSPCSNLAIYSLEIPKLSEVAGRVGYGLKSARMFSWNCGHMGCDPFNQNSNRSDREKWSTLKGGPVFFKLFRLDPTDPLSFGPKFRDILVEWIAPMVLRGNKLQTCSLLQDGL